MLTRCKNRSTFANVFVKIKVALFFMTHGVVVNRVFEVQPGKHQGKNHYHSDREVSDRIK